MTAYSYIAADGNWGDATGLKLVPNTDLQPELLDSDEDAAQAAATHGIAFDKVAVLTIATSFGTNVTVHRRLHGPDSANAALVEFVNNWWTQEMDGMERPDDDGAAVEAYFEKVEHESYLIFTDQQVY